MAETDVLGMFKTIATRVESGKQLPEITRDARITTLGIDSVSMMEIIGEMEDELDITIPDEKLAHLETVADIEKVVRERLGNA